MVFEESGEVATTPCFCVMLTPLLRFTRSLGDACMKDVDSASFYNDRVPDGLAKMLPLPKKPYVSNKTEVAFWSAVSCLQIGSDVRVAVG